MILDKAEYYFSQYKAKLSFENVNREFKKWISSQKSLSGGEKAYNKIDDQGRVYQSVSMAWPNKKQAPNDYFLPIIHPVTNKPCVVPPRGWRNPSLTMKKLLNAGLILFGKDELTQPRRKYLLSENMDENLPSLLYFGGSDTALLEELKIPFDTPKVVQICKEHIQSFSNPGDIILDFFSGSATTAHAILRLNSETGEKRKYIQVQLQELIDDKSLAFKEGYNTICELGKERIRRASSKIKAESNADIDYGFRVYRLDESNMEDVYYRPQEFEQKDIDLFANNVKPDRSAEDLLTQVILDWGLSLDLPIEQTKIESKIVFKVAGNSLFACFENNIDEDFAKEIAKDKPLRIVFKDSSFKDDTAKENVKQLLEQLSPETEMKVI